MERRVQTKQKMKILRKIYFFSKKSDFFSLFEKVESWETDFRGRPEDETNFKGKFRQLSFIWYMWH